MASRFFSFLALSLSKGLFFVVSLAINAQETVNLVPNPSFEEFENGCPIYLNEMPFLWERWRQSPNSFSTCVVPQNQEDSLGWAPLNGFGHQLPYDGDSYIGFAAFGPSPKPVTTPNFREYIGTELLEPLVQGTEYFVQFRVSLALNGWYWHMSLASSSLGAIFTTMPYHWDENPMPIPNFAHVYTEEVITDTLNWVLVSGSFVADSVYTHMGLGVFFEFDYLNYIDLVPGLSLGSYYYVDDVCVSPFPDCLASNVSVEQYSNLRMRIFPNPTTEYVQIQLNDSATEVRLLSLSGVEIMSEQINQNTVIRWNLSALNQGLYIVEVKSKKQIKREKLMVLR